MNAQYSDAELQRKRMSESKRGAALAEERLRTIEIEMEETSRALRRAQARVALAHQSLEEFEDRHWALLSLYSPEQAKETIIEAFKEFEPYLASGAQSTRSDEAEGGNGAPHDPNNNIRKTKE
jgi:hypothetical protein